MKEHGQQESNTSLIWLNKQNSATLAYGCACAGQVLWAKGYTELVELMKEHGQREGTHPAIDCYGNGEDLSAVREVAKEQKLGLNMKGGIDHIDPSMHDYKVTRLHLCQLWRRPLACLTPWQSVRHPGVSYEVI